MYFEHNFHNLKIARLQFFMLISFENSEKAVFHVFRGYIFIWTHFIWTLSG